MKKDQCPYCLELFHLALVALASRQKMSLWRATVALHVSMVAKM